MSEAKEITKKSRSNLAFAFFSLPKVTRDDITTFYAFCRHVDDAADDPDVPLAQAPALVRRLAALAGSKGTARTDVRLRGKNVDR